MPSTPQSRGPKYNRLKRRALAVFAQHEGWLDPPRWAIWAGFYPVRAAYSYLLRLHRFGLLIRSRSQYAVRYRLSARGRSRLAWLEKTDNARTSARD